METSTQDRGNECVYEIDSGDRIVYCNEAWDSFAIENNGVELRFDEVKGKTLWEFVADPSTTDLYQRLIAHVRAGNVVRFNLRCDSPTLFRLLEMEISALRTDHVRFATSVMKAVPRRDPTMAFSETQSSLDPLMVCSWCGRVRVNAQQWMDVDAAVSAEKIFEREHLPPISHGICGDCLESIGGLLDSDL